MGPANVTVPSAGATMLVPTSAAMSIPRCPLPYGVSGGSNVWMTGPTTGHVQPPADAAGAAVAPATLPAVTAGVRRARATMIQLPRRISQHAKLRACPTPGPAPAVGPASIPHSEP